ncbi:DUF4158 domain-containing protein [Nonomuraea wenchangensis]|uniref:DUF4158 domain-containing protein n=1 Tax=Nonomuraea wenchangensis TaxID=568860 RepID=UPI0033F022FD
MILKFYEVEGRFPGYPEEIPAAAVEYVASLVKVEAELLAKYSWRSRTIERHRAQPALTARCGGPAERLQAAGLVSAEPLSGETRS